MSDITKTPNSKLSGRKPLTTEGAMLAHNLRVLQKMGYTFTAADEAGGVVIRIEGLHIATAMNGNMAFEGVGDNPDDGHNPVPA